MAELVARWRPEVGVVELAGAAPGPAGVAAVEVGRVRYVVDAAAPEVVVRVGIDVDGWLHPQDRRLLAALAGPAADTVDGWTLRPEPAERALPPVPMLVARRLARLTELAEVLAADPLGPAARAVARLDHADAALEAAALLPGLVEVAREGLWEVATDPDAAELLADLDAGRRAEVVPLVTRVVGRTGDPELDVALRDLARQWGVEPPPPDLVEPLPTPVAPAAAAPMAAPAADMRAGAPAMARRAAFAGEALDAAAPPAPPAPVLRVDDEVRVLVPSDAAPTDWVRVARRAGRVLLGAAPVGVARDGRVRVPVPAGVPTEALVVDVVDDPSLPVREEAGRAHADAVTAGRAALAAERRGRTRDASARWAECADGWAAAGDADRAADAARRATAPSRRRPLLHDRLP